MNDHHRTAAFFDLDKTIIARSSTAAFSRELRTEGMLTSADALRTAYAQFVFSVGSADARQTSRLRDAIAQTITGWEAAKVRALVEDTVDARIDPLVYEEALGLIRQHQRNGRDVVIVSASGAEVVEPIAHLLGTRDFIASEMEVVDGRYTGNISLYCYGPVKAEAIRALALERQYDLTRSYAYSDSITDAPMLNEVGFGYAVNPDRVMRKAAIDKGWGVLRFVKPVALRKSSRQRTLIVVGVAAAVAGLVWWGVTHRRTRRPDRSSSAR